MGQLWPKQNDPEVRDGDEPTHSPNKNQNSLLATERGTDSTRRIETDTNNNLYVSVAADGRKESLLYSASLSSIADSTPTAFVAFVAPAAVKIYKVLITGSICTDFTLRHLGSSIGIKQTNLEMGVEFNFPQGYELAATDTLDAVVEHFVTGKTKSFNLYVYGE